MSEEESYDYIKAGLPPGSLVHIGKKPVHEPIITVIDYNEQEYHKTVVNSVEDCFPFKDRDTVTWINVDGVHQSDVVSKLCDHFGIHPLVQEDIMHTNQRPKMEDYENYIYIVMKMIYSDPENDDIDLEQLSIVAGKNYLLTFQEYSGDVLDNIRTRLEKSRGIIRKMKTDYLAYSIMDAIVDNYFTLLEDLGERIEDLEDSLIDNPTPEKAREVHELRRMMLQIRRAVWPLRELTTSLQRPGLALVYDSSRIYLRDLYDHIIQVMDSVESYRDMLSGMLDIYLSSVSNRMNEVMKVLTIISTIFIPMTFIAGIYGMNFKYMPELEWKWGYFVTMGIMAVIAVGMLFYFRRKKWL